MSSFASAYGTRPGGWRSQAGCIGSGLPRGEPDLGPEVPGLQVLLDALEELRGGGAVDDPVVPRHRQIDHVPDGDGVVDHHRALLDGVECQDRALRRVDDRHADDRAERAGVGDGERPALDVVGGQVLRAGPDRQSTRLNSSYLVISFARFFLEKKTLSVY